MHAVARALTALTALVALAALGPAAPVAGRLVAQYPAPRPAPRPKADSSTNPLAVPPSRDLPAVRVSLSMDAYLPGDRARVGVRPRDAGYLLVLHADPAGRVRVLFPLDPVDTQRVRGGSELALNSHGGRDAFTVGSAAGDGAVLAAISAMPFRVTGFTTGDHWDVRAFPRVPTGGDAEGELVALAQRMLPGGHFDYDVATYRVGEGLPVVSYGTAAGGAQQGYEQGAEQGGYATTYADEGLYDYYSYGVPFYGGLFPIAVWGPPFRSCPFGFGGVSGALFPSCFSVGFFPHHRFPGFRHKGPFFGHRRRPIGRGWLDDPTFPGNPNFGEPRGVGGRRAGAPAIGLKGLGPRARPGMGAPGIGRSGATRAGAQPQSNGGVIVYRTRPPSPAPTPWMNSGRADAGSAVAGPSAPRPWTGMTWTPIGARPAAGAAAGGARVAPAGGRMVGAPVGGPTLRAGGGPVAHGAAVGRAMAPAAAPVVSGRRP